MSIQMAPGCGPIISERPRFVRLVPAQDYAHVHVVGVGHRFRIGPAHTVYRHRGREVPVRLVRGRLHSSHVDHPAGVVLCIALCVITLLNVRTARLLKQSAKEMPGGTQLSAAQGREKVANMVVVLTLVFSVSYVPNFLLRVLFAWAVLEHDSDFTFFVSFASFCLFFLNSCFNPIALLSISIPIRDLFLKYIRWHRLKTKDTQVVPGEQIPFQTIDEIRARRLAAAAACRRTSRIGETVQAAEISIHV
ncbi:uncharacterized protein [Periplaneta americana]|uniref:uncharacterized protein isoform X2 n=1 Tax=Periplaneta americana TaxID=6978 RepID=UPI0037E7106C